MTEKTTALKARKNLGELLNKALYRGDSFIIERAGKEVAALVPLEEFRILLELRKQNFSALDNIWKKLAKARVPEEAIAEAIASVRGRK